MEEHLILCLYDSEYTYSIYYLLSAPHFKFTLKEGKHLEEKEMECKVIQVTCVAPVYYKQ